MSNNSLSDPMHEGRVRDDATERSSSTTERAESPNSTHSAVSTSRATSPAGSSPALAEPHPSDTADFPHSRERSQVETPVHDEQPANMANSSNVSDAQAHAAATTTTAASDPTPKVCWICRGAEDTSANPLLHGICLCVGSIGHVHTACIYEWIRGHGSDRCPNCRAEYRWRSRCKRQVPKPDTALQKVVFVTRYFVLPLIFQRLLVLLLLKAWEWLLMPLVVGWVFYGEPLSGASVWHASLFRWLEMWLLGLIFLLFSHAGQKSWKAWCKFFASHHTHQAERLAPYPIDELDRVYYEANAALHRARHPEATEEEIPLVYQDADPNPPPHGNGHPVEDELSSETDEELDLSGTDEEAADMDPGDSDDEAWEDTETDAEGGDEDDLAAAAAQAGPDALPNGAHVDDNHEGAPDDGDAALRQHEIMVSDGYVTAVFNYLDHKRSRLGRARRLRKLVVRRWPPALLAALLLRTWVGRLLVVVALLVCAVALRCRCPRRRLRNARRRFDEMAANALLYAEQVPVLQKRIWFATFLSQMALFSFVMPTLGGVAIHYGMTPFFASAPASFGAFVEGLNVVRLVWYWCLGTSAALLLMTMESNVMVPLFAPGVDLYFIRAIDLHFEIEQYYYELILAQIYDTDPLGVLFDFCIIAPLEVLALLVFIAFPVWGAFGVREALFQDISLGRIKLPLDPLMTRGGSAQASMGTASTTTWAEAQLVQALATTEEFDEHSSLLSHVSLSIMDDTALHTPFTTADDAAVSPFDRPDEVAQRERMPLVQAVAQRKLPKVSYGFSVVAAAAALQKDPEAYQTLIHHARLVALAHAQLEAQVNDEGGATALRHALFPSPRHLLDAVLQTLISPTRLWNTLEVMHSSMRVVARPDGLATVSFILTTMNTGILIPFLGEDDHVAYLLSLRPSTFQLLWELNETRAKALARSPLPLGPALSRARLLTAVEGPSRRPVSAAALTSIAALANATHYTTLNGGVATALAVIQQRWPFSRLGALGLDEIPLRYPFFFLLDVDAFAITLVLTAAACLFRFPMQRAQLSVLRPVAHWLARWAGDIEWFLFDPERDAILVRDLAEVGEDVPVMMPMLPVQRIILRRQRNFRPDQLPAGLQLRVALYSLLFLLIGCTLFWCVPILGLIVVLGIPGVSAPLAAGAAACLPFLLWRPVSFFMSTVLAIAAPFCGVLAVLLEVGITAYEFVPRTIVLDTWKYVAQEEKVLIPYAESP